METSKIRLPLEVILYLIHHIFLPPKLPQKDDFNPEYERILLDIIIDNLLKFKDCATYDQNGVINSIINMVSTMRTVRDSFDVLGVVNEGKLKNALRDLCVKGKLNSCDLTHSKWPKVE